IARPGESRRTAKPEWPRRRTEIMEASASIWLPPLLPPRSPRPAPLPWGVPFGTAFGRVPGAPWRHGRRPAVTEPASNAAADAAMERYAAGDDAAFGELYDC